MRRPAFANDNAPLLEVTVFIKGSKKAALKAVGKDPSDIARSVSLHNIITPIERDYIRPKLLDALTTLSLRKVANCTGLNLDVGGRRIRCNII